jgi:hypothetical protein
MRCPNCGYISFDYLDQCVKCRTDLTGERQRLNLLDIHPNPISFQEIMERMPIITQREGRLENQETTIIAKGSVLPRKPEIDLSQGLSLDISIPSDLKTASPAQKSSVPKEEGLGSILEGLDISSLSKKRDQ